MEGKVTVEQALSKGRRMLKYYPMMVTFGIIGLAFYLGINHSVEGWIIPIGFLIGFISGWLVWSYYVNIWKVWAYENVRNINELHRKAVNEKLIWQSGSWFEKTEFKNYHQKQKLKQLEKKFLENDIYLDDITVPDEIIINYSKSAIYIGFCLGVFIVGIGIYAYVDNKEDYFFLIVPLIGIYLMINSTKKIFSKEPQIILNNNGIKLKGEKFMIWEKVSNEIIEERREGRHLNHYITFEYNGKTYDLQINDLGIRNSQLENLLHVYRVRYNKKNPS